MTRNARPPGDAAGSDDLAWRVIGLLNIFRLLVPMVLVLLLFFDAPSRCSRWPWTPSPSRS
jgi:hypothetical protein